MRRRWRLAFYLDPQHVRMDLLEQTTTETYCPYKGTATYWSARVGDEVVTDVAWSYQDPLPESAPFRGCLSFDKSHVTLRHDMPIGD